MKRSIVGQVGAYNQVVRAARSLPIKGAADQLRRRGSGAFDETDRRCEVPSGRCVIASVARKKLQCEIPWTVSLSPPTQALAPCELWGKCNCVHAGSERVGQVQLCSCWLALRAPLWPCEPHSPTPAQLPAKFSAATTAPPPLPPLLLNHRHRQHHRCHHHHHHYHHHHHHTLIITASGEQHSAPARWPEPPPQPPRSPAGLPPCCAQAAVAAPPRRRSASPGNQPRQIVTLLLYILGLVYTYLKV